MGGRRGRYHTSMSDGTRPPSDFGPNTWLIEEMYRELQEHPESVSAGVAGVLLGLPPGTGAQRPASTANTDPRRGRGAPAVGRAGGCDADPRPGPPPRRKHGDVARRCPPPPRCAPSRSSSSRRTARSSTSTWPRRPAARSASPTSSPGRWSRRSQAHPAMRAVFLPSAAARPTVERSSASTSVSPSTCARRDGSRALVVPGVKRAAGARLRRFFAAYNDLIRRAQRGQLGPDDFAGRHREPHQPGDARHHPLGRRG